MEAAIYERMAAVEDRHWWFAARRAIVDRMIDGLKLTSDAEILEGGCGTGGNFPMLRRHGRIFAVEPNATAREFASRAGLATIEDGRLPDQIPFGDRKFDLAIMTDVLEHLSDDVGSLKALRARLNSTGWLILTVPAYQWMWSGHDVSHHHLRRYTAKSLKRVVDASGFDCRYASYCNLLLFPAIAAVRLAHRALGSTGKEDHDLSMPSPIVNRLLYEIYASERYMIGRFRAPFGVSLIALAHA